MSEVEEAVTVLLISLALKINDENKEQKKKRAKRSVWVNPWLRNREYTISYNNIFQELRLNDNKEFRRYLQNEH